MRTGKLIEFTRTGDLLQHFGKLGFGVQGIGEGPGFHDEFGELDFVQGAHAIGQLNTRLEGTVALTGPQLFPFAGLGIETLDGEMLGPHPPRGRHGSQRCIACGGRLDLDRGDHVNQGVQHVTLVRRRQDTTDIKTLAGQRLSTAEGLPLRLQFIGETGFHRGALRCGQAGFPRLLPFGNGFGLTRPAFAGGPGAVGHHARQHHTTRNGQCDLQGAHTGVLEIQVDSAMETADSMSTATMRETPCSCMVTPISCSAISMAILLCEMNRNWVSLDMLETRRA